MNLNDEYEYVCIVTIVKVVGVCDFWWINVGMIWL